MIQELQIRVMPQVAASTATIRDFVAREKGVDGRTIKDVRILKRSIDARHRQVFVNLTVRLYINEMPSDEPFSFP